MIPVAGFVFDGVNGIWYAAEGDWENTSLSVTALIPVVGEFATPVKYGAKTVLKSISDASKSVKVEKAVSLNQFSELIRGNGSPSSMIRLDRGEPKLGTSDHIHFNDEKNLNS